ncbi:MAG TPA: RsmB/NOP family class I SAM-dependent RNA methyltransferase [Cyclobacteriaceae bacterium]|jgi:16S rRNA (cytosine967-C5)-methyltransferase|nr:RsmB/NOP family class I SAM-dependent RNA methyltransferase [Cyclobacteriaceae bacterium]
MKLYRNTSAPIVAALEKILSEGSYADKVIEKTLKINPKWPQYDKRFIAETIYDIIRNYRFYKEISGAKGDDFWGLYGAWCVVNKYELQRWDEFQNVKPKAIEARIEEIKSNRRIMQSIPNWLDEIGERELGAERWEKEMLALNEVADIVLRTNTLKINRDDLKALLLEQGIKTETSPDFPDALLLQSWYNVFKLPQFKEGLFEVQDAGSQLIAPFLRCEPGMRVIDACAGTGGKTLHLAALLKNKGRIIAMDNEEWKLEETKKRGRRAGVSNVETKIIESSKSIKRQENSADRLLLDVPCSGLGVLKRNPDAKWKLSAAYIEEVKTLQQKIITDYSVMLKKGGLMVYSTCSILPGENEKQVQQFITANPGKFELLEEKRIWPSEGFDGFYMAVLKKI